MKTVQMTLEPELVAQVDRVARRLGVSRSAFTRRALQAAIERLRAQELERRHRDGYRRKPVRRSEFDAWTREQLWPDCCGTARSAGSGFNDRTSSGPFWS